LIKILERINEIMAKEGLLSWWEYVKETLLELEKQPPEITKKYRYVSYSRSCYG
jgi:hypothetical protein